MGDIEGLEVCKAGTGTHSFVLRCHVPKVYVRFLRYDTRLSWDPAAYGNITSTHFRGMHATNAENSEIWLPDVQLYNANVGNEFSLDNALAVAYSDGSVFWSRPWSRIGKTRSHVH